MKPSTLAIARRNLKFTILESALTRGLLCMSIMTPFFNSIGLDQLQISKSQIIFTIVMLILNVPTGWLADRFSRKLANAIGDFGAATIFVLYSTVNSFGSVVICECFLGFFMALSQGVDSSLLMHYCRQIEPGDDLFHRKTAQLNTYGYICMLILVSMGSPIGSISFRLAIALSSIPYFIAGAASLLITDDGEHLTTAKTPLLDMIDIVNRSLHCPSVRLRLFAYAIGREMTHAIIWTFTPMLVMVGIPLKIVSLAWAFNAITCLLGTKVAEKYGAKLKEWQNFAIPLVLMILSMSILAWRIDCFTVWFYCLMGIVQGWTGTVLLPMIQKRTPMKKQTTVISLASNISRLVYIPSTFIVGWAADIGLRYVPLAVLAIFVPLGFFIIARFKRE